MADLNNVQELNTEEFFSHLLRHPIPEIMDDECLDALSYVVRQYGDTITHGAGLEVRLGEEARYVDYIMNIDEDSIPGIKSLWYEIDYEEFQRAGIQNDRIVPCLFANTDFEKEGRAAWDKFLPPFLGEERDGIAYLWNNRLDTTRHIVTMDMTFFVRESDGRYRRFREQHRQRAHSIEEIQQALQCSGFEMPMMYGEWRFDAPTDTDTRIHFVTAKKL